MRARADRLRKQVPGGRYEYRTRMVEKGLAFLEWTAFAERARIEDRADSYLIRDCRIQHRRFYTR